MQKLRPIEDYLDVAVSLQNYVKTSGHSRKTVQKKSHVCWRWSKNTLKSLHENGIHCKLYSMIGKIQTRNIYGLLQHWMQCEFKKFRDYNKKKKKLVTFSKGTLIIFNKHEICFVQFLENVPLILRRPCSTGPFFQNRDFGAGRTDRNLKFLT
jgi:hypothetical protein